MPNELPPEALAALLALEKAATPGDWEAGNSDGYSIWRVYGPQPKGLVAEVVGDSAETEANAMLVPAARNSLLPIITALLAARAEIANLRGAMAAQDERERLAGERCGISYAQHACDWPDGVAEAVLLLRADVERLTAERDRLRVKAFCIIRSTTASHTTACTIWGDDGQGWTREGFKEPLPCNCGALENFYRARAEAAEAEAKRYRTALEKAPCHCAANTPTMDDGFRCSRCAALAPAPQPVQAGGAE